MGFKQELFPGIPIQVFPWIKLPNFGNEVEKEGKNSQKFPPEPNPSLAFPKSRFSQPKNPRSHLPFPENPASKKPKIPKFPPSQQPEKQEKSILESQKKREKTSEKSQLCFQTFLFPPNPGGRFLGRAGPGVPWLRPEENPGIFLIQIHGILGFFQHQRSFLCRISQAILFRK